ncbi:MAG: DUF3299 domain-containing protein [Motiliproteus sp.]
MNSIKLCQRSNIPPRIAIFLMLLAFTGIASSGNEAVMAIEWKDLIPAGWEEPLLAPEPNEEHEHHVDAESLNAGIDGRRIKFPGYMVPVKFTDNQVQEFILVPFLEHHVQRHAHHNPNQMAYVKLQDPVEITNPYAPYWVTGDIGLTSVETDEGPTGYLISSANIEIYVY